MFKHNFGIDVVNFHESAWLGQRMPDNGIGSSLGVSEIKSWVDRMSKELSSPVLPGTKQFFKDLNKTKNHRKGKF